MEHKVIVFSKKNLVLVVSQLCYRHFTRGKGSAKKKNRNPWSNMTKHFLLQSFCNTNPLIAVVPFFTFSTLEIVYKPGPRKNLINTGQELPVLEQ